MYNAFNIIIKFNPQTLVNKNNTSSFVHHHH